MDEYYLGYIFTSQELQILFSGLGITEVYGLPVKTKEISADEEMLIIRQLLRKNILTWDAENGYQLESKFKSAFDAVKKSLYSLSLVSCNYPFNGYVCFPGNPVVIWEINGYMEERFTLLLFDVETFSEMLINEGFIPNISDYCSENSDGFISEVKAEIEKAAASGDLSLLKYPFIIRKTYSDFQEYVIVSSDVNGNHIIILSNDTNKCISYDSQSILEYIKSNLKGDDVL